MFKVLTKWLGHKTTKLITAKLKIDGRFEMSKNPFDDNWVPAQVKQPEIIDLRSIAYGPRGFKLKNKDKFGTSDDAPNLMEVDSNEIPIRLSSTKTNKLGNGRVRISAELSLQCFTADFETMLEI